MLLLAVLVLLILLPLNVLLLLMLLPLLVVREHEVGVNRQAGDLGSPLSVAVYVPHPGVVVPPDAADRYSWPLCRDWKPLHPWASSAKRCRGAAAHSEGCWRCGSQYQWPRKSRCQNQKNMALLLHSQKSYRQ